MLDAKPVTTPLAENVKLTRYGGTALSDPKEFRMIIGSLQYLFLTRPNIAYAVNKLSQYMQAPTNDHLMAAKRVLRYLCGTSTRGLYIDAQNSVTLHVYSDTD